MEDVDLKKRLLKNVEVFDFFYANNQTFLTKEELIKEDFDFSVFFSTSTFKHYFDIHENKFKYQDFRCGPYYIKTRDKNLEKPDQKARLFFQIIKVDFSNVELELKHITDLLRNRKFTDGSRSAYRQDVEMRDYAMADHLDAEFIKINAHVEQILPRVKSLIASLENTKSVFIDLQKRLEANQTGDENWV